MAEPVSDEAIVGIIAKAMMAASIAVMGIGLWHSWRGVQIHPDALTSFGFSGLGVSIFWWAAAHWRQRRRVKAKSGPSG